MSRIPLLAIALLQVSAALAQCTEITLPDPVTDHQFSQDAEPSVSRKFFYPAVNEGFFDDVLEVTLAKVSGPDDWNYQFCEGVVFCRPIQPWETSFTIADTVYSEMETEYDVEFIAHSYGTGVLDLTIVREVCPDDTIRQTLSFTLEQGDAVAQRPQAPVLAGAWPNPFNPSAHLAFRLPSAGLARVEVVDLAGRLVAVPLAETRLSAGEHEALFDGAGLPSGVYLYRVVTPFGVSSAPMTLLK